MSNNEKKPEHKTPARTKAGRTLLVKPSNTNFDASIFDDLSGLSSKHHIEKSNSYFLTFKTAKESLQALKKIKSIKNARVKFAQYRIFFKMEGLTDSTDYNSVKNAHTELVKKIGGDVLYYRLYRKDNKFIGCGDMTIDTKDAFDKLISSSEDNTGMKQFKFDGVSGTHFRYKKTDKNEESNANDVD
jgi:hypothetical protein